jgi:hypothetical protein
MPMGVSDFFIFLEIYMALEVFVTVRCMDGSLRVAPWLL